MARGGARNRGPLARSSTSEAARIRRAGALVLPAEGHRGTAPTFPLPDATPREQTLWEQAWRTPQAAVWAMEAWRWPAVAMWVRWSRRMEEPDAPAAVGNVVVRLGDQIGMTPAGLIENAWRIAEPDEPASTSSRVTPGTRRKRPGFSTPEEPPSLERARRRAEQRKGGDPRDALQAE